MFVLKQVMKGRAGRFEFVQKNSENEKWALNVSIDTNITIIFTKTDLSK